MLVLTRKVGETIVLGSDIELTVIEVKGEQVKIGIQAPGDVKIFRKEIYDAILKENQKAALPPHIDQLKNLLNTIK